MTIPAGTLVPRDARDFGSYQLLAKLATGGMAEIYLARPQTPAGSKDVLVLKRILPHLAEDEHFVTMFRDEADLASKLVHQNVCQRARRSASSPAPGSSRWSTCTGYRCRA